MRTTNHGCPRMYFVMTRVLYGGMNLLDQIICLSILIKSLHGVMWRL